MKRILICLIASLSSTCLLPSTATAQQALVVKALAEKKVTELPAGPLFWRLENFLTLAQAQVAAGSTGLAAESSVKVWLLTLGLDGESLEGSTQTVFNSRQVDVGDVIAHMWPERIPELAQDADAHVARLDELLAMPFLWQADWRVKEASDEA